MEAVPEDYLRSTVFLCVDEKNEQEDVSRNPKATGFWVRVPIENTRRRVDYIVTARHCIDEARPFGKLYIRYNLKGRPYQEIPTSPDDWLQHDAADVAAIMLTRGVLPPGVTNQDVDHTSLRMEEFVGAPPDYDVVVRRPGVEKVVQPRVGHQIFFIGLFTEQFGQERNLPVARFGHISRMPSKIAFESAGTSFDSIAYLAEFHSQGGHSGSPAFFLYPLMLETHDEDNRLLGVDLAWVSGFIGLISAHYDLVLTTT